MPAPFRIAVLASGAGTNLQALIDAVAAGELAVDIVGLFSDKPKAFALERARAAGIATTVVSPKRFATREEHDEAFFAAVDSAQADLIVCAGYMRIIAAAQIERRPNRMINLHPSLLPAFKGLHTHLQALDAGVAEHGASVHVVTADLDDGPVLAQARVPVLAGDDAESLGARVRTVEHPLLIETVRLLAEGRLRLGADGPRLNGVALAAPLQLGANRRLA
ncbi:phosphoribosylglycinamide formyltransferase [Lysobacter brunescens]|uniref:Phosphoribosylglycinamide formyltransferase n=1 Tax=Lysobacter brunescens TaxID=262323 RepID=A0ABW2YI19_9GAMM